MYQNDNKVSLNIDGERVPTSVTAILPNVPTLRHKLPQLTSHNFNLSTYNFLRNVLSNRKLTKKKLS